MEREKIVELAKTIGGTGASICVGIVTSTILDRFAPIDISPLRKFGYSIGASILCGMTGAKATEYVEESVDNIDEMIKSIENGEEDSTKVNFIKL